MYIKGLEVNALQGSEILADAVLPIFDRTWRHFCSHRQAPSSGKVGYAGIVKKSNVIYFAHPIFRQYNLNAPRWCKQLFLNAIDILLPEPLLRHQGPTTLLTTLNEQKLKNRWVLHLLNYIPERRCREIDIIEDVIPIFNLKVSIKIQNKIKSITCVPEDKELDFKLQDGRVEFIVPEILGHQMISLNYFEK